MNKKNDVEEKYFITDNDGNTLVKEKLLDTKEISLVRYNNSINKKQIKILLFGLASLCVIGMIIGLSAAEQTARVTKKSEENTNYKPEVPPYLKVNADDYVMYEPEQPAAENPAGITETNSIQTSQQKSDSNASAHEQANQQNFYNTYTRTENSQSATQQKTNVPDIAPKTGGQQTQAYTNGIGSAKPQKKSLFLTMENAGFAQQANNTGNSNVTVNQPENINQGFDQNQMAMKILEMQSNSQSDYQKQNMQKENTTFLEQKRNTSKSGNLLSDYSYVQFPDSTILATTMIPITLITGINSDLPGDIIGQVTSDIYDSLSGNYLLIPKGSRVYGSYNSSVAFGQERALIAWLRLIRPDGVTVNFKGFQGADLRGYAGFHDKVDNHFDQLAASLGISTGVNLLYNSFVTLLSSVDYLDKLAELSGASDNAKKGYESLDKIIEKIGNRQPTLIVREGYSGYVFVSENLFLPPLYYYNDRQNARLSGGF